MLRIEDEEEEDDNKEKTTLLSLPSDQAVGNEGEQ